MVKVAKIIYRRRLLRETSYITPLLSIQRGIPRHHTGRLLRHEKVAHLRKQVAMLSICVRQRRHSTIHLQYPKIDGSRLDLIILQPGIVIIARG